MYETYSEMQHRTLCENNSSLTNNIINPQCSDGKKENEAQRAFGKSRYLGAEPVGIEDREGQGHSILDTREALPGAGLLSRRSSGIPTIAIPRRSV